MGKDKGLNCRLNNYEEEWLSSENANISFEANDKRVRYIIRKVQDCPVNADFTWAPFDTTRINYKFELFNRELEFDGANYKIHFNFFQHSNLSDIIECDIPSHDLVTY